jgi:hypothetical protein
MRYLFVLFLFVLGVLMLGSQHTHESYEVYGVAVEGHSHRESSHTHWEYAQSSHDHDGDYAECGYGNRITCSYRHGSLHTH